jgi:hypothetical protein
MGIAVLSAELGPIMLCRFRGIVITTVLEELIQHIRVFRHSVAVDALVRKRGRKA